MSAEEIKSEELNPDEFIATQVKAVGDAVGDDIAINALSGGVDSAVVTMLGHKALGDRLKTYFIENGLMREGEPQQIVGWFADLGVKVEIVVLAQDIEHEIDLRPVEIFGEYAFSGDLRPVNILVLSDVFGAVYAVVGSICVIAGVGVLNVFDKALLPTEKQHLRDHRQKLQYRGAARFARIYGERRFQIGHHAR